MNSTAIVDRNYIQETKKNSRHNVTTVYKEYGHVIVYEGIHKAVILDRLYPANTQIPVRYLKSNPHIVSVMIENQNASRFEQYLMIGVLFIVFIMLWLLFKDSLNAYRKLRKAERKMSDFTMATMRLSTKSSHPYQ